MLATLIAVAAAAGAIKLFVAICGHHITWRLAFALVVLIGCVVLISTSH